MTNEVEELRKLFNITKQMPKYDDYYKDGKCTKDEQIKSVIHSHIISYIAGAQSLDELLIHINRILELSKNNVIKDTSELYKIKEKHEYNEQLTLFEL